MHNPIPPSSGQNRFVKLLIAVIALIVVVIGLRVWNVPYYALTPGDATPVAPLVKIEGLATQPHHDKIMLTDVYLQSLSAWQYIFMHLQAHVEFVPASELTAPGVPQSELLAQGYLQMYDSKEAAEVAALRALGWKIPVTNVGTVLTSVASSSPASAAKLAVADRIISADGKSIANSCDLIAAVHSLAPGASVHLRIERAHVSAKGDISYATPASVTLVTAKPPFNVGALGCSGVKGSSRSWLGISLEDALDYTLPGKISIDTSNIGGPSAGLAMTLTLIDELSAGSLTGHWPIAATGTIDASGHVGDVGGVAEKTVAVQRAGAKIFIVPQVEVATARSVAQSGLRILGVTTLHQALKDLHALGGSVPVSLTKPQ